MDKAKRKKLEARGWKVGTAAEFLDLSLEESQFVELKFLFSTLLRRLREQNNLTQVELAMQLGSSQSRVAKMEAGSPSVSIDLSPLIWPRSKLGGYGMQYDFPTTPGAWLPVAVNDHGGLGRERVFILPILWAGY